MVSGCGHQSAVERSCVESFVRIFLLRAIPLSAACIATEFVEVHYLSCAFGVDAARELDSRDYNVCPTKQSWLFDLSISFDPSV